MIHPIVMRKRPYERLIVWREAHTLCINMYALTKEFPAEERYGIKSQMRRSSYSIPMNLAEGNSRRSQKEKIRFIDIAIGSLEELHYQCLLAHELHYLKDQQLVETDDKIQKVGFLLMRLQNALL